MTKPLSTRNYFRIYTLYFYTVKPRELHRYLQQFYGSNIANTPTILPWVGDNTLYRKTVVTYISSTVKKANVKKIEVFQSMI